MENRTKYALWLGFFGFCLVPFGEFVYTISAKWIQSFIEVAHNLYYNLSAGNLVIIALVFYKLSYKDKLLQRLFEAGIFYAIAKFGNELTSRATSFDNKEIWYWSVLALYTLYRVITIKKK